MTTPIRVLQVAASDLTVDKLLLPLIDRLSEEGYEVHAASSDGPFAHSLAAQGYRMHAVPVGRNLKPANIARGTWALHQLIRRERFDVVHVHTPVAAAVGRLAARLAGVPLVMYTAHGFYFHDRMSSTARRMTVAAERAFGRLNHVLFTQSQEDAQAAVKLGIAPSNRVVWISNGVDVNRFKPGDAEEAKRSFGIGPDERVVGFVGRLVAEKGIFDLLEAMKTVSRSIPNAVLMVAGDSSTAGDRDQRTATEVRRAADGEFGYRVHFTGFINDIERMMAATDVFVLPSYREGMPRSIIEAMASGKPVVATNIRGCREEVVPGGTGFLYEPGNVPELASAIGRVLGDRAAAARMGIRARERALQLFDQRDVLERQVAVYREQVERLAGKPVWSRLHPSAPRNQGV